MSESLIDQAQILLRNRRVQIGAGGVFAAVVLGGLTMGGLAMAGGNAEQARPEAADRAGLAIEMQQVRPDRTQAPIGKLATLDPSQDDRAATPPTPMDPDLAAAMRLERRQEAEALAEQRAFDAKMKADMDEITRPTPAEPPRQAGSTSNSEDAADQPGG